MSIRVRLSNFMDCELDTRVIDGDDVSDQQIRDAVMDIVINNIVNAGDTIKVDEI